MSTVSDVAAFFGVERNTVTKWIQRGMPGKAKAWPLDQIAQWLRVEIWPRSVRPAGDDESTGKLERRKMRLDIKMRALKFRRECGELVEREAVAAEIEQAFARVKARLEQVPEEVGTSVPANLQQSVVGDWRDKINLILKELAHWSDDNA